MGELLWRECVIPVSALNIAETLDAHLADVPRQTPEESAIRVKEICEWIDAKGGVEAALMEAPLLLTLRHGRVKSEDGHHRLGIAHFLYGATHVRALCAVLHPSATLTATQTEPAKPKTGMSL